ncbi:MAG: ATP-binding protein [Candidatus Eremiobacteraeota bacterium]|nr:ATP-binding protein [Candidatus Eremiobacteraeota bacterium]
MIVYGENLRDTARGVIHVKDNGLGMTVDEFQHGFMRIASRQKETGQRSSKRYGRRYTGEKGIGRLAAHKLAELLEVDSIALTANRSSLLHAIIDWNVLEKHETLEEANDAIILQPGHGSRKLDTGTSIILRRLRQSWTERRLKRFARDVNAFQPPNILIEPPSKNILPTAALIRTLKYRDEKTVAPFDVELQGDFDFGEDFWGHVVSAATWLIEIDASDEKHITVMISPLLTSKAKADAIRQGPQRFRLSRPLKCPQFQARILVREGASKTDVPYLEIGGVRIYMEGFRVLPYADPSDDWLGMNSDVTKRQRSSLFKDLDELGISGELLPGETEHAGLNALPQQHYVGAVFLRQSGAQDLKMLVNREGFLPNESFESLQEVVRGAVLLSIRVRSAFSAIRASRGENQYRTQPDIAKTYGEVRAETASSQSRLHDAARKGAVSPAIAEKAAGAIGEFLNISDILARRAQQLNTLASLGTVTASLIHELSTILGMTRTVEVQVERLKIDAPYGFRNKLVKLGTSISEVRRSIERQAASLTDVIGADARRRRIRQSISERFESSRNILHTSIKSRALEIVDNVPHNLRSTPMFSADIMAVLMNLLTNAIKNAQHGGKICAWGDLSGEKAFFVMENTGKAINIRKSERYFQPYESRTPVVDPQLGQGMGLGLTITRNILEQNDATIKFVQPSPGYATAARVDFLR